MRKRIRRALFTASAAGATLTTLGLVAMSPAYAGGHGTFAPSGGTPIATDANCTQSSPAVPDDNCAMSGYEASGRNFRFAKALINIPDTVNASTDNGYGPQYVALDNSGTQTYQYTRVGISPCPTSATTWLIVPNQGTPTDCATLTGNTSGWVAFAATADQGNAPTLSVNPISSSMQGDGVTVSAYLVPTGNAVHTVIDLPGGTTYNNTFTITGPVYTDAQAVEDWTTNQESQNDDASATQPSAPGTGGSTGTVGIKIRDAQFFQGQFTTASGATGTFRGPWTLNALEATSNGSLPPGGTLIGQPSYLWTDGNSYHGLSGDAFGLWRYPF